MRPPCPQPFFITTSFVHLRSFVRIFHHHHHHHHHHHRLIYIMVHSSSTTLSILRALRDRASISPISTPLLNSAGMDFMPSIHSLPTPISLEVVVVVVVILPVTDPAERANRSSLDGPTTSAPASRTVPTSAGPSPNRECSSVVVVVVAVAPLS